MDTYDFLQDPRTLPLDQRLAAKEQYASDHQYWLSRLRHLTELPVNDEDFPAFLLATPVFADLRKRIGKARTRPDLSTEVADEVDWFCSSFHDYLRTCDGEDSFSNPDRRSC